MIRYAAFLRGINLGNRRIKMDDLRDHFRALGGIENVATFIASGNVVFETAEPDARALERTIERHLGASLGYDVATFIRTLEELGRIRDLDLFPESGEPGYKVHVMFLGESPPATVEKRLGTLSSDEDRFRVIGREAYWLRLGGLSDSKVTVADLEWALEGRTSTMRTMNTVTRLIKKFSTDA